MSRRPQSATVGDAPGALASGGIVAAGRYHIKRLLGEGAKKRVFLAHDAQLDRDVAIGVLKAGQLDAVALDRIRREAQAMARLGDHPGIVSVFDIVSESGVPFIVSQYMAGGTLHDWMNGFPNRRPPIDAVLRIGQEICAALSHAHGHGIVHRDVKPTNVWLTSAGDARLGDFGLAVSADHSHLANEGVMVGTVAYMAPEQALGKPSEPRTDLYAVGALLYELTTGQPPFVGETALSVLSQHIHSTPVPPSRLVPSLPRALESLILSLLAKTPDGRPPTAVHVEQMLHACESGVGATVPISTSPASADPVFVGREREMSELRAGVEDALAGQGRLFLVSGDPGIGKTRLVEQLTGYARGRGMHVLVGRCYEGEGAPAFWPWVQAIRTHAESRDDDLLRREMGSGAAAVARVVPEIAQRFPDLRPDPTTDDEQHRFRLFESITHLVKIAAQRAPLMIVLDDLHWADRASLLLLQFVAREIGSARVLIVATHRDAEIDVGEPLADLLPSLRRERACRRVALRGLAEREVRELIARLAALDVPEAFVGGILRGTEGNPFFVEEILRHLIEERILERHEGGWTSRLSPETMRLPESIRAVVDRRLDRLGEACRRLLHIGAVIGREFDVATVERLADANRAAALEVLEEALQARIVAQAAPGRFAFTHALVREALYEELPRSKRADLHATVAAALEETYPDLPDAHLVVVMPPRRQSVFLFASLVGLSLLLVAFSLSTSLLLSIGIMALIGVAQSIYLATNNTLVQLAVPDALQGRVMSVYMTTWGLMPLGALPQGVLADWFGAPVVLGGVGLLSALIVVVMVLRNPALRRL